MWSSASDILSFCIITGHKTMMVNKPTKNDSNCNFKLEKVKRLINIKPKFKFMSLQISPNFQ